MCVATKVRLERRHEDREILVDRRKSAVDLMEHVEGGIQLIGEDRPKEPESQQDK